jgi:hypothetical protein
MRWACFEAGATSGDLVLFPGGCSNTSFLTQVRRVEEDQQKKATRSIKPPTTDPMMMYFVLSLPSSHGRTEINTANFLLTMISMEKNSLTLSVLCSRQHNKRS